MKAMIHVQDRTEATAIVSALDDPDVRAFVLVMGALLPLRPSARERVLTFVQGHLNDQLKDQAAVDNTRDGIVWK